MVVCTQVASPGWTGCLAVWAVWNQGCPVLEGAQILWLEVGPQVSCCYWVRCSPTMPSMARVILSSIKHQAQDPGRSPKPSLKARTPQGPRGREDPGTGPPGRVVRRRVAGGLCISPSHRHGADKFNIGFHAPPSRTEPEGGGRQASLRLPQSPPSIPPPPTSTQCDQSIQSS